MSQLKFAEHLGIAKSTVTSWELKMEAAALRCDAQATLSYALKKAPLETQQRFQRARERGEPEQWTAEEAFQLQEELGLSKESFADLSGIPLDTLEAWVGNGSHIPRPENQRRLDAVKNDPFADMTGSAGNSRRESDLSSILSKFIRLKFLSKEECVRIKDALHEGAKSVSSDITQVEVTHLQEHEGGDKSVKEHCGVCYNVAIAEFAVSKLESDSGNPARHVIDLQESSLPLSAEKRNSLAANIADLQICVANYDKNLRALFKSPTVESFIEESASLGKRLLGKLKAVGEVLKNAGGSEIEVFVILEDVDQGIENLSKKLKRFVELESACGA